MNVEELRTRYEGKAGPLPMVVVRPEGPGPFPAMIDLHGGAWTWFSPEVNFFFRRELARRGFVMIAPTFRTSLVAPWPACFEDAQAALAWVRGHAAELRIDPARIGTIGGSTGGHLATMLGLSSPEIAFVVALWPILDVEGRYRMVRGERFSSLVGFMADRLAGRDGIHPDDAQTVARLRRLDRLRARAPRIFDLGATLLHRLHGLVGTRKLPRAILFRSLAWAHERTFGGVEAMRAASPIELVRVDANLSRPPILVVQGDRDPNVTVDMTESFAREYRRVGGEIAVRIEPGLGHSYGNVPSREAEQLVDRVCGFAGEAA